MCFVLSSHLPVSPWRNIPGNSTSPRNKFIELPGMMNTNLNKKQFHVPLIKEQTNSCSHNGRKLKYTKKQTKIIKLHAYQRGTFIFLGETRELPQSSCCCQGNITRCAFKHIALDLHEIKESTHDLF